MTEARTKAGKRLLAEIIRLGKHGTIRAVDDADIAAIEAGATAAAEQRLRSRIEALEPFGEATHDADWGWRDCRNAVLALLKEPK